MRALLFALPLALAACTSDAPAGPPDPADGPGLDDAIETAFSADADACDLLQPAHAAQALGVPEASVSLQTDVREMVGESTCPYRAEDGRRATLSIVTVEPDAAAAEAFFEASYRTMTAEESAAASAAMRDALSGMEARGEVDADVAEMASGATDGAASMGERTAYEPVDIGDQASVTLYQGQFSGVQMRLGNAVVAVTAEGPDDGSTEGDRAPTLALARAVAASR